MRLFLEAKEPIYTLRDSSTEQEIERLRKDLLNCDICKKKFEEYHKKALRDQKQEIREWLLSKKADSSCGGRYYFHINEFDEMFEDG